MTTSISPVPAPLIPRQADTDAQVIQLWLQYHDSRNTRRSYQHAAAVPGLRR